MVEFRDVETVAVRIFIIIGKGIMRDFRFVLFQQVIVQELIRFVNAVQSQVDEIIRVARLQVKDIAQRVRYREQMLRIRQIEVGTVHLVPEVFADHLRIVELYRVESIVGGEIPDGFRRHVMPDIFCHDFYQIIDFGERTGGLRFLHDCFHHLELTVAPAEIGIHVPVPDDRQCFFTVQHLLAFLDFNGSPVDGRR